MACRRDVRSTPSKLDSGFCPPERNGASKNYSPCASQRWWVLPLTDWRYLCTFLDLLSSRVVGWATSNRINAQSAKSNMKSAIKPRNSEEGLVANSDRGSQFCSHAYRSFNASKVILQSTSKTGSGYANCMTKTLVSKQKKETIHEEMSKTRKKATVVIFDHISVFYNRSRMHSFLGYLIPVMYVRYVA